MDAIVLHHIVIDLDFHAVEANLRQCFRILAAERACGDVLELPGITIASSGVAFQMFNAAFLNSPVDSASELERRIAVAAEQFAMRGLRWSFWLCEDWAPKGLRRKAGSIFQKAGLNPTTELPGMVAQRLSAPAVRRLEMRPAKSGPALVQFRQIGALCFHVPPGWFAEVFDERMPDRAGFHLWVAYSDELPIGTAAAVVSHGVAGLYNIAILPEYRRRGYGSEITALAAELATRAGGASGVILQASSQGLRMYERMGFRTVTRVLVYNSG